MSSFSPSPVLLLSVGIFLGSFTLDALAAGIGTTSSRLSIPRIGINRSSKDNGGSLSYTGAEYATHRPYKVDFDLLQASDLSHELEMPLVRNNDILDEIFGSDPTLRSRRRRRRRRQVESQQVISATSSDFQRFNLCLPYFNTNPLCRQIFFGLANNNNNNNNNPSAPPSIHNNLVQNHAHGHHHVHHPSALAVPSSASPSTAFFVPAAFPPSSSSVSSLSSSNSPVTVARGPISRNDLAILNYYQQQQFPPQQQQNQAPFQQLAVFQGPIPVQRQRPAYDNIHTKYPYPYPPTLVDGQGQQPPQVVVPESVSTTSENVEAANAGVTTDVPSDVAQTTLLPEAPVDQQQGAGQQDPSAPVAPGHFPDSPHQQQPQEPPAQGSVDAIQTTTYIPAGMVSSSPSPPESQQPVDLSTPAPSSQEQQPPAASQGGSVPVSPDQQNEGAYQQPPPLPIQVQQAPPPQPPPAPQIDLAMQKKLKEKEEEIIRLKTQLEQSNLQVVSYEQENGMLKDQFMRSEEANIKLRDRVLQLENTNQHLQEQNGQLQQVAQEQRQQINLLKIDLADAKNQLDNYQNQVAPLPQENEKHRKEIEEFLIRIRTLGEENDNCKKQVRLYQLKVNYIMEQQRQQQQQQQRPQQQQPTQKLQHQQQQPIQQLQQQQVPLQPPPPQKKKQPSSNSAQAQLQQQAFKQPTAADLTVHDDELDPELSRMDAEIAALQKSADAIQQPASIISPAAGPAIPESAIPPVTVTKKENEFPGEAVQVDPQQTKHKQQLPESDQKIATAADVARAESASREVRSSSTLPPGSGLPAWEQPAGF